MSLPRKHGNHITAHTHNSNLVTGYILLCSRLYNLNIIKFGITTRNFWRVVNHFLELAKKYYGVVFVEDGVITGGIGEYLNGLLAKNSFTNTRVLGFEDKYYSHGTREEILEESGLSSVHIEKAIKSCSK